MQQRVEDHLLAHGPIQPVPGEQRLRVGEAAALGQDEHELADAGGQRGRVDGGAVGERVAHVGLGLVERPTSSWTAPRERSPSA